MAPNWIDTLEARERGEVDDFVGKDVDPDAPQEAETAEEETPEQSENEPEPYQQPV